MDCHLAGRQYNDADEVWTELRVGTKLGIVRDQENRFDPRAVAFTYTNDDDTYVLGYVPADQNEVIAALLDAGWGHIFEARISSINTQAHPEQQVHVTIKLKRNTATTGDDNQLIKTQL